MNEFSEYLRCNCKEVASRKQSDQGTTSGSVISVLEHLHRYQEASIKPMNH